MPIARVEINGRIARVEVPAGTTPEQARQMALEAAAGDRRSGLGIADLIRGGPQKPTDNSRVRGFVAGALKPLDNLTTWAMHTPPMQAIDKLGVAIGLPSAAQATAGNESARRNNSRTGYQLLGNIAGTLPTAYIPGGVLAQGAVSGALLSDKPNDLRQVAKDATIGAVAGKAGQLGGKYVLAPIAERAGRTKAARAVVTAGSNAINQAASRLPPRFRPPPVRTLPNPQLSRTDRAVSKMSPELQTVRQNVQDAANLNLPYALADAHPKLQSLAGSVVRHSPDAKTMATQQFNARSMGQADRAVNAIDQHLAPITNIEERAAQIRQQARAASQPLYDEAYAQPAPFDKQIDDLLNTPAASDAARRAYDIALNSGKNPAELDTLMARASRPANMVGDTPLRGVAPANVADDGKIYVGPAGGSHFQVTERFPQARFTGDTGFVNPKGEYLTREEALAYVNGAGAGVKPSSNMPGQLDSLDYREQARPVPAASPTFESLDLIKKGLDGKLNDYRNPFTRKLDLEGNPEAQSVNDLLQRYKSRLDDLNDPYKQARAAYAENIEPRSALFNGQSLASNSIPQRQFDSALANMSEKGLPEARRGYATAMADQVAKQRFSTNPYNSVYGSPLQQGKVGAMFPEGAPQFDRQYRLEDDMAATAREALGGSQTQSRNMADQLFQNEPANLAMDAGIQAVTGGGVPGATSMLAKAAKFAVDRRNIGLLGAEKKATEMAPRLLDTTDPKAVLAYLDDLARKSAEAETRRRAYQQAFGALGLPAAASSHDFGL